MHTDHCAKQYLGEWVDPLLDMEIEVVRRGEEPLFQSHMWDGSTVPLQENLDIASRLLEKSALAHTVLEIEIGAVGGEEDGHRAEINEKLYSTVDDARLVADRLGLSVGSDGAARYMAAFTFGNVHGSYKPCIVKLRPEILRDIQGFVGSSEGQSKPFYLVFHGGSGSTASDIARAVSYGVVKMNIDTDTQYAFTRAIAGHMMANYDKVLKIDGEVGDKSKYDPRSWGREAEDSMAARVIEACVQLGSAGRAI